MNKANYAEQKINKSFCSIEIDGILVELVLVRMDYIGEMNGGILSLQIHQIYKNDYGDENSPDRKAVLVLPKTRTQCITGIDCLLNKKKIDLKIEETKAAESIANEAEKQGKTSIRSETTPDDQFLNIHLGSISYGSEIDITIHTEILSTNSDSKTYQTIIPFSDQPLNPTDPTNFTFSIVINQIESITDIDITSSNERYDFKFDFNDSILTIDKKPIGPIVLLTKFEKEIPNLIQNDLHDEYSVISVIPHFLSKPVNSDFIFIVDCSGSMSGSRIKNASECLSIFLHSLPVGCKFNIILFGGIHKSVFGDEGLVDYNEANLQTADKVVNNLKANMGGTNLLGPLKTAYEQCDLKSKKGNVAQIFLLTDGEIHDTETVFKLVSKNRSKSRIFSIGIGKDADRNLVSGLAVLSFGKFDFVSESTQITDKVINLLSLSLAPALTNVSIHAADNDEIEIVPNPMTPIYDGNLMNIFIKRSSKETKIDQVLITGNIGDEEAEIVIDEVCNICDLSAKKLFALNAINDYEKMYDELMKKNSKNVRIMKVEDDDEKENKELKKLKDRIVTLSVENGIISKFTSFVGVEEEAHKIMPQSTDNDKKRKKRFASPTNEHYFHRLQDIQIQRPNNNNAAIKVEVTPRNYDARPHPALESSTKMAAIQMLSQQSCMQMAAPPMLSHQSIIQMLEKEKQDKKRRNDVFSFDRNEDERSMDFLAADLSGNHIQMMQKSLIQSCANAAPPPASNEMNEQMNFLDNGPFVFNGSYMPNLNSDPEFEESFSSENDLFESRSSESSNQDAFIRSQSAAPPQTQHFNSQSAAPPQNQHFNSQAAAPPPSSAHEIEKNLSGVVTSQDFDGKWKPHLINSLFEFFGSQADAARKSTGDFFSSIGVKEDEDGGSIRSTVVALCVLHKMFEKEQLRWRLIENKALQWLRSKMKSIEWEIEIQKLLSTF